MKELRVEVQRDHLEALAAGRKPVHAIAELIWNAVDADATLVTVEFDRDFASGIQEIRVIDNGTGIPAGEADAAFSKLGGSWKRLTGRTRREQRVVHGQEGKGRFLAFALGNEIEWISCYDAGAGLERIELSGRIDSLGTFRVSDPVPAGCESQGTTVRITGIPEKNVSLVRKTAVEELAEVFAFYLRQYPHVRIKYGRRYVDPTTMEDRVERYALEAVETPRGVVRDAKLTVIEWKSPTTRSLYLCNPQGFALHAVPVGIKAPKFNFTAYLESEYIQTLNEENALTIGDLDPGVEALHEAAKTQLRTHFRRRTSEAATEVVQEWKRDRIYPYSGEANTLVEKTERQVFDVLAVNVNEFLPEFASLDRQSKRFSLRLIRQALETNPTSIQRILSDVLDLPKRKQDELAQLLDKTSLGHIISAAKLVADRLNFLRALEVMIYDKEPKEELRERNELQRILADHTWLFGEEFHLAVDDESLTELLRKHLRLLGRDDDVDEQVVRDDGRQGIIDMMLSQLIPGAGGKGREHLVVELKRPSKKIDPDVINQIESYAFAVAKDERFRGTNTRWVFWALSNDMTELARFKVRQKDRPPGLLLENEEFRITIWVKTWAEVIEECRARLRFFEQQLNYTADRETALAYLRATHERYFPESLRRPFHMAVAEENGAGDGDVVASSIQESHEAENVDETEQRT